MPADSREKSESCPSSSGVLCVLYLASISIEYRTQGSETYILPATAMALDAGTLLLVSILRKAGRGIFLVDASVIPTLHLSLFYSTDVSDQLSYAMASPDIELTYGDVVERA